MNKTNWYNIDGWGLRVEGWFKFPTTGKKKNHFIFFICIFLQIKKIKWKKKIYIGLGSKPTLNHQPSTSHPRGLYVNFIVFNSSNTYPNPLGFWTLFNIFVFEIIEIIKLGVFIQIPPEFRRTNP